MYKHERWPQQGPTKVDKANDGGIGEKKKNAQGYGNDAISATLGYRFYTRTGTQCQTLILGVRTPRHVMVPQRTYQRHIRRERQTTVCDVFSFNLFYRNRCRSCALNAVQKYHSPRLAPAPRAGKTSPDDSPKVPTPPPTACFASSLRPLSRKNKKTHTVGKIHDRYWFHPGG